MLKRARPDVSGQIYLESDSLQLKRTKIVPIPTNALVLLTLPNVNGTLALLSQIPSIANLVDLTSAQTISGVKTFTNGISATNVVDLASAQTISGVKTFTNGISATNVVDLASAQTISGIKTFAGGLYSQGSGIIVSNGNLVVSNGYTSSNTLNLTNIGTSAVPSLYFNVDPLTGWFRPLSNQWSWAANRGTILTLSSAGATINGKVLTNQLQVGFSGSTTTTEVRGQITYNIVLAANSFVSIGLQNYTGNTVFGVVPSIVATLTNNGNYWDQCSLAVTQATTSQVNFSFRNNNGSNSTSGSVTINYIAWV